MNPLAASNGTELAGADLLTPTGLARTNLSWKEIATVTVLLKNTGDAIQMCQVDLGRALRDKVGVNSPEFQRVAEAFHIQASTLEWRVSTMSQWPRELRQPGLVVDHYREINRIPAHMHDLRMEAAEVASETEMSIRETRELVASMTDAQYAPAIKQNYFAGASVRDIVLSENTATIETSRGTIILHSATPITLEQEPA